MMVECCDALLTFAAMLRTQCLLIITLFAVPQFQVNSSFFLVPLLCLHSVCDLGNKLLLPTHFCILSLIGKMARQVFWTQSDHSYFVMNATWDIFADCCFDSSPFRRVSSFNGGGVPWITVFGSVVLCQLSWLVRLEGVQILQVGIETVARLLRTLHRAGRVSIVLEGNFFGSQRVVLCDANRLRLVDSVDFCLTGLVVVPLGWCLTSLFLHW